MGLFDRLKAGLSRTTQQIAERFDELVGRADSTERRSRPVDVDTVEELEELLIMADVGVAASARILDAVSARARRGESLRELVRHEILAIFHDAATPVSVGSPHIVLVVGVNGVGKTTTIGKLASLARSEGRHPLICAADTFRAAAIDQLQIWADRAGVEMIRARDGADPAAVVFDAVVAGRSRGRSPVFVDTAGRLHNRANLMQELDKIRRIAAREVPGAPHEVLIVIDATVGQNGVSQAREFTSAAGVTGVVLTKLDGTAKGGVAVAIANDLKLPIRYVGVGEGIDDLLPFSPEDYVTALFEEKW
jgi:fused signal recognition particle receptor